MPLHRELNDVPLREFGSIDPKSLFVNHVLMNTRSPKQAMASVEKVFFRHSLRTSRTGLVDFVHRSARLESLSFNLIKYGADVEVSTNDINRSHYVLVIPLSGAAEIKHHDRRYDLDCGRFVMLDPMANFHFDMQADHSHLAIGIPRHHLAYHINRTAPKLANSFMGFERSPYIVGDNAQSLFGFLGYICNELDSPRSLTSDHWVSAAMAESFLSLLVSSLLDCAPPDELKLSETIAPLYVQKAEDFILSNLTEEISIAEIVGVANVPERTLYHAFQKFRGASPMNWLKRQRLRQARIDLLESNDHAISVTEIALRYQISHIGRFARAYYEEFGERPSDTLKRKF